MNRPNFKPPALFADATHVLLTAHQFGHDTHHALSEWEAANGKLSDFDMTRVVSEFFRRIRQSLS